MPLFTQQMREKEQTETANEIGVSGIGKWLGGTQRPAPVDSPDHD
jgi:hypothetical protein